MEGFLRHCLILKKDYSKFRVLRLMCSFPIDLSLHATPEGISVAKYTFIYAVLSGLIVKRTLTALRSPPISRYKRAAK